MVPVFGAYKYRLSCAPEMTMVGGNDDGGWIWVPGGVWPSFSTKSCHHLHVLLVLAFNLGLQLLWIKESSPLHTMEAW